MDIHEYQAKEILANFGVEVPSGALAYSPEQAAYRARELGGERWIVKAQVHAGGRGKAGGVKLCDTEHEIYQACDDMFGQQAGHASDRPGRQGHLPRLCRKHRCRDRPRDLPGFRAGPLQPAGDDRRLVGRRHGDRGDLGGTARQHRAGRSSNRPSGFRNSRRARLPFKLGLEPHLIQQMVRTLQGCYAAFSDLDATMVEINPLVVTGDVRVVALDAKMSFDDNALFRHPQIAELRDKSQEDPRESRAADRGLSYVGLDGNIGCIVNGAGLAMATMDTIKLAGGEPANFLDIGGGASPERVAKAFRLVLSDDNVQAVLVNIFAGINRCDWVAEGVVQALRELEIDIPVVVRLAGTNVEEGQKILAKSGLPIIRATTLMEAAERAVGAWQNDLTQATRMRAVK